VCFYDIGFNTVLFNANLFKIVTKIANNILTLIFHRVNLLRRFWRCSTYTSTFKTFCVCFNDIGFNTALFYAIVYSK